MKMKIKRSILIRGGIIAALLILYLLISGHGYKLTRDLGRISGKQNLETWYNLPMDNVVQIMRERGYSESDYPYCIREDGCKMLGDFIMIAADLNEYPRGTVVYTTLGQGLVCDTGEDLSGFDIAVDWR